MPVQVLIYDIDLKKVFSTIYMVNIQINIHFI